MVLREDIQKKTAERVKLVSFTSLFLQFFFGCLPLAAFPSRMVLRSCPTRDGPQRLSHQGWSSGAIPPGKVLEGCPTRDCPSVLPQNLHDNPDRDHQLCKFWDSPKGTTLMGQPPRTIPDGTVHKDHPWWDSP